MVGVYTTRGFTIAPFLSSSGLHVAMGVATLLLPAQEPKQSEPIVIEIVQNDPVYTRKLSSGAPAQALATSTVTQKAASKISPAIYKKTDTSEVISNISQSKPQAPAPKPALSANKGKAKIARTSMADIYRVEEPEALESELADTFDDIDQNSRTPIASDVIDQMSARASRDMQSQSEAVEQEIRSKDLVLAQNLEKQKQDLNKQRQLSEAAEQRAEQLAADRAAAARAAAQAAARAGSANGRGLNGNSAQARTNFGSNDWGDSSGSAGVPRLRKLEDLRQMPGNRKPMYSDEERFEGAQGTVMIHAFISNSGKPTQLKLVQPTGYHSLDKKSLDAVKKWRFFPGQEGWAEIPVAWTLAGDAQPKPTLLRRR